MFSFFSWTKKEVLVVVAILGVILSISVVQLRLSEMKSRDSQRRADTEVVARGLKAYFKQYGKYPESGDGLIKSCGNQGLAECVWGDSEFIDEDGVTYIKNMPKDPFSDKGYKYVYLVDEKLKKFRVYARLENTSDPVVRKNLTAECGNGLQCNWYVE